MPFDGTPRTLLEQSEEVYFEIPQDEHGSLRVSGGGVTLEMRE